MENWDLLARHHRGSGRVHRGCLGVNWPGDLERDVVGIVLRREVATELVPGLVAIQAGFLAANAEVLGKGLP